MFLRHGLNSLQTLHVCWQLILNNPVKSKTTDEYLIIKRALYGIRVCKDARNVNMVIISFFYYMHVTSFLTK